MTQKRPLSERTTFKGYPLCDNCGRGELAHVWRCDGCDGVIQKDAEGLPARLHAKAGVHCMGQGATLFCLPFTKEPTL